MLEVLANLDFNIVLWIQNHLRVDALNTVFTHLTSVGGSLLVVIALVLVYFGNRRERLAGITALVAACVEVLLVNGVLKVFVARPRPFVTHEEIMPLTQVLSQYSFPSGHTALAFALAFVFYRLSAHKHRVYGLVVAALVGFSRMYLGVHYLSDVLGGIVIGYLAAVLAERVVSFITDSEGYFAQVIKKRV